MVTNLPDELDLPVAEQLAAAALGDWSHWPAFRPHIQPEVTQGTCDIADLLWDNAALFEVPYRNAALVLAGLHQHLKQIGPTAGAETFLARYAQCRSWPRDRFAAWWSDPRRYAWARLAHELAAHCFLGHPVRTLAVGYCQALGASEPGRCLSHHLEQFGQEYPAPPCVAHCGDYLLPLQPGALYLPGTDFAEPALRAGVAFHEQQCALVEEALAVIARYTPALFDSFRRSIRLAALKPRHWGKYDDISPPELPGSFIASAIHNSLELADHLIHEMQHNRLSFLEEYGPLLRTTATEFGYYSPWRDDLRQLYGLFHGLYVHTGLARFWSAVYQADDLGERHRTYVLDRLTRIPRQMALAVAVLDRHAPFTALGRAIFDHLRVDTELLRRRVTALNLPAHTPALRVAETGAYIPVCNAAGQPLTAREAVQDHLRRIDRHQQCAGVHYELPSVTGARGT